MTLNKTITIRPYQQNDWQRLCDIHDKARLDELRGPSLEAAFLPMDIAAEREGFFEYQILVAEKSGEVTGFVAYDEEEIAWLYVDPSLYRSGTGRALVTHITEDNRREFCIEVLKGNDTALAFYESLGFTIVGTASGVMPGNESFNVTAYELSNRPE